MDALGWGLATAGLLFAASWWCYLPAVAALYVLSFPVRRIVVFLYLGRGD